MQLPVLPVQIGRDGPGIGCDEIRLVCQYYLPQGIVKSAAKCHEQQGCYSAV